MYGWTNANLQRPDGLYWDHVGLDGTIEKTIWSYNQGVPVGVNVLLYEVTGQRHYLREAERIAAASYEYYVTGGRLDGQPAFFNSIYFKNLLLLESVTQETKYRKAMADYAERTWNSRRDPATGLFHFAADGNPHVQMIEQAAMVQIYAVLAWRPADYHRLY
jgi:predicted alpha-1,6-mannanase (GH76 family)